MCVRVFFFLFFGHHFFFLLLFFFLLARQPALAFLLRLLSSGFYLILREHRSLVLCSLTVGIAFFLRETASSLGCTVHRYSYGTLFAFLPFSSSPRSFVLLLASIIPAIPRPRNEKETRLRDSPFRYRYSFLLSFLIILGNIKVQGIDGIFDSTIIINL